MTKSLQDLETEFRELDARLKPIAKRHIDLSDRDWGEKLAKAPHPLDAAGVRDEVKALVRRLIESYRLGDEPFRTEIRALVPRYDSLAWVLAATCSRVGPEALREELILFSIIDQGQDPRDAKLWLDAIRRAGRAQGENFKAALTEAARLSSAEDRYGWGSTQTWLAETADESGETPSGD